MTIKTIMLWAYYPDTDGYCLLDAWDEQSTIDNDTGFAGAVESAKETAVINGGEFFKTVQEVDMDSSKKFF